MSEGDVSLIRDEDVLRRMWQQTEDFSRKKEIRAHMYRLREERLRNLYSPEPGVDAKGCEFTTQGHVKSFADQNFQSMKSKEVRDASSPSKEFTYRGQDLKELSNAGWNVESENRTIDDGHTHVKSVHANIEGRYDVDGGHGQFAAADYNKQAVTEYDDGNTNLKRDENVSNTSAHEQILRKTKDGMHSSSTTSSSTSTSKFEQVSSTRPAVPYQTNDDYDLPSKNTNDTNRNDDITSHRVTKTNEYDQNVRNDFNNGELVSRKVDYPDDNTKVIVETRCLPDGTRVTSTRREFRGPSVQTTRSEQHSHQTKTENKSYESSQKRSQVNESSSKTIREMIDNTNDIVDTQKIIDDYDFKRNKIYTENKNNDNIQSTDTYKNRPTLDSHTKVDDYDYDYRRNQDYTENKHDEYEQTRDQYRNQRRHETSINETSRREVVSTKDDENIRHSEINETQPKQNIDERVHNITRENIVVEKITNADQYQSTYQTDYNQRKISNDWSPAHQAWASTLRSDTPTRPSTRASSPGSKTFKSSTSSLRSSISPDKTYRKPSSRGGSPNKIDRHSPSRIVSNKHSSTQATTSVTETKITSYSSPEERPQYKNRPRLSTSPEKPPHGSNFRPSSIPDNKPENVSYDRQRSPNKNIEKSTSPQRWNSSPIRKPSVDTTKSRSPSPKKHNSDLIKSEAPHNIFDKNDVVEKSPDRSRTKIQSAYEPQRISSPQHNQKSLSPTRSSTEPLQKPLKNLSPTRKLSQDTDEIIYNQPGYMRPTASSKPKPSDDTNLSNRKSPTKYVPFKSHETKSSEVFVNEVTEQHYRFIDEETKMFTRNEKNQLGQNIPKQTERDLSDKNNETIEPSQLPRAQTSPAKVVPINQTVLKDDILTSVRSPKKHLLAEEKHLGKDIPVPIDTSSKQLPKSYPQKSPSPPRTTVVNLTSSNRHSPSKDNPPGFTDNKDVNQINKRADFTGREKPSTKDNLEKYSTVNSFVDDKECIIIDEKQTDNMEHITFKSTEYDNVVNETSDKIDTQQNKELSPSKCETFDKKRNITKTDESEEKKPQTKPDSKPKHVLSQTPTDRSPRNSMSPSKSLTKDKYKQTSEFIGIEKTTEEINKSALKERPRQLITPSTSPTRKPKNIEKESSSGQSSPTTSVSGFVYFSTPTTDTKIVTDLDDQDFYVEQTITSNKQKKDVIIEDSQSTKIPCRSPSPDKWPTKDRLPRKSSLKKSSNIQISPTEKPPSSFLISPNVEIKEFTDYKVQIDHSDKEKDKPIKTKPPFERRETYEERCRKILGMMNTDLIETDLIAKETTLPDTKNVSSPSVPPCRSPSPGEYLCKGNVKNFTDIAKTKEFTSQEAENNKTVTLSNITDIHENNKTPSRSTSPTKLQNTISTSDDQYITENLMKKTETNDQKKSSPVREIVKSNPTRESNNQKFDDSIVKPKNNTDKKNLTTILTAAQNDNEHIIMSESTQITDTKNTNPERPKSKPQIRYSPAQPTQDISEKSHRPTSPTKKQTKPNLNITKSDKQTTETVYENPVQKIIEDETDYALTGTSVLPIRKIPVAKAGPIKNTAVKPYGNKVASKNFEYSTEFIMIEKETELLDRNQKSSRKHSVDRTEKSLIAEKNQQNANTLSDEETSAEIKKIDRLTKENLIENDTTHYEIQKRDKSKDQKISSRPPSRNVSPTKKVSNETSTPTRSISPKKPQSPTERPQSPQVTKVSGVKPRDQMSNIRKPSPNASLPTKIDKTITTDNKKLNTTIKQSSLTKTTKVSSTKNIQGIVNKVVEQEPKKTHAQNANKDYIKKDLETKVTRTTSDITLKTKKASPQRIRSKPEIQVNDKITKQPTTTMKYQKNSPKEPHTKLPTSKPKSATALNMSLDDDDIIIDVQQAKSSRENSPDRICPTPVGFLEDTGTPRFPDEVNEPDDEFHRRTYQTIHETESIVDDIVEICEDDELFVKRANTENFKETDDSLLSVNDKVSKFNIKIDNVSKTKDTPGRFKETDRKIYSDLVDENLKSDHCLLTVSEKVNKFAKGPIETKDKSPCRNIVEEYDKHTTYQDDYTKLSVNDKAHLFIETAENVKTSRSKPAQKVERPDLTGVDETLRSDDCLLSVSDKVNKFVKTAEQFLHEAVESEEKDKKIREQHEKIMRKFAENLDDNISDIESDNVVENVEDTSQEKPTINTNQNTFAKQTASSTAKNKDISSRNVKSSDKLSSTKVTTLRSSEAVKKAKALFENIASNTAHNAKEVTHTKTIKLADTTLTKKIPETNLIKARQNSFDKNIEKTEKVIHTSAPVSLKETTSEIHEQLFNSEKLQSNTVLLRPQSPDTSRPRSSSNKVTEMISSPSTDLPNLGRSNEKSEKPSEKIPSYQRPTKTSQMKEENKLTEEAEISSRRGSGKFGVELRRTSIERTSASTERRRSSVEHHQPCIEDIFDLDLLEQMLEKVVGYEQRRRIRAQMRVAKKKSETDLHSNTVTKTKQTATKIIKTRSPECLSQHKSPERPVKSTIQKPLSPEIQSKHDSQKSASPERTAKSTAQTSMPSEDSPKDVDKKMLNGHAKGIMETLPNKDVRSRSPNKAATKVSTKPKSPLRHTNTDKKSRPLSPTKTATPKPKSNRFSEYASAYMKKVGLNESDKNNIPDAKVKKVPLDQQKTKKIEAHHAVETKYSKTTSKNIAEQTSSKDTTEIIHINGKRSPSPQKSILESLSSAPQRKEGLDSKRRSPDRKIHSPDRKQYTDPHSPDQHAFTSDNKVHKPSLKSHSPDRKTHIPDHKAESPDRKALFSDRKAESPNRKAQSPDRKTESPDRKPQSPDYKAQSPDRTIKSPAGARNFDRLHHTTDRLPNSEINRQKSDTTKSKKETIIKNVYEIEKKVPQKQKQEEKPSWVTNRNLKKITSETRTFSTKKVEPEKPKYRSTSPSKTITKPIDVITSSYGPGPLDADGRPLFGIKALRNGASNYQVKGTVIRQEFHSRNGGEPEGTVQVTAYSTEPEDLEKLLQTQGEKPSRIHGLAAITTTKKFGGDTGTTFSAVNNKEERAALDQFTHSDRRIIESRITSGTTSQDRTERKHTQKEKIDNIFDTVTENRYERDRAERVADINEKINDRIETSETLEKRVLKDNRKTDTKDNKQQTRKLQEKTERRVEMETAGRRGNEKTDRTEKRVEDRKTVRQSSVKSLTEKYIKSANETSKSERTTYPKAGLILRTSTMKDSISSDSSAHAGLARTDSEHSLCSEEEVVTTTTTEQVDDGVRTTTTTTTRSGHGRTQERSFLDSSTKVTGVQDILTRMKNADIVIEEGDSSADTEARALLNKFLGATVLMAGMQNYVTEKPTGKVTIKQETVQSSGGKVTSSRHIEELDIDQCWDERVLRKLLDECSEYEQRRRLRARLRTLMAEQEACASAVTEALAAAGETETEDQTGEREEEEVTTITSSVRRNSSEKTISSSTTIKNSKVIESMTRPAPKPVSPFAKFRQLEKQNSTNSANSPKSPQSPGSPSQPYFKFTDPALQASAVTIKERLLQWCRDKTRDYENVKLENFSTSWADGLAFCALLHHFLPNAFDYSALSADKRRHNFTLAFKIADEKAGIYPLLDVDDMVAMRKPDWKCVFTYVQSIYRRFKDEH